ncbi:MAG: hypothetical protein ACRDZ4_08365, partial [Egibacteraceae bacterium]
MVGSPSGSSGTAAEPNRAAVAAADAGTRAAEAAAERDTLEASWRQRGRGSPRSAWSSARPA